MKRQRTSTQNSDDTPLSSVWEFLGRKDWSCDEICALKNQLCALDKELDRLYAEKISPLLQSFPPELWLTIFYHVPLSNPHQERPPIHLDPFYGLINPSTSLKNTDVRFWLATRTVSKAWCSAISKLDLTHIIGKGTPLRWPNLLHCFKASSLYFTNNRSFKVDVNLLTSLQNLRVDGSSTCKEVFDTSKFTLLTQLTNLTIASDSIFESTLVPLTNLQSLTLIRCRLITSISTLTNLHTLDIQSSDHKTGLTQSTVECLPKLTRCQAPPSFWKKGVGISHEISLHGGAGTYEGEWLNGKHHGHGVWSNPDAFDYTHYEGEWQNGRRHGHGVAVLADGLSLTAGKEHGNYEGYWAKDKPEGHGVLVYVNGDKYQGTWKAGRRHGSGVFTSKDGRILDGEWSKDKFKFPDGTFQYPNRQLSILAESEDSEDQGTPDWSGSEASSDLSSGSFSDSDDIPGGLLGVASMSSDDDAWNQSSTSEDSPGSSDDSSL